MRTMITAHSGAENTRDNTLESVRYLVGIGADALEIDVNLLDGELVLSHDRPAEGEQLATVEACFRIIAAQEGLLVNADIKHPDIVARVIAIADAAGMHDRILFTGDVLTDADFRAAEQAGIPVWYNHTQVAEGTPLLQGATQAGFDVLNANYRLATEDMLAQPERLSLWTVNEEAALMRFLAAGVRNITTRIPVLAMRLREEIQGAEN